MCFAPQRCALFRHLNLQKWSEPLVFLTFWLRNVLRATTACTFLTSQLPKVVRTWFVLYILTSKCASRHNGVQFFISHLASWLCTRRFSEPTFRPSWATNHWRNTVSRLSYLFAHLHLLSSYSFSSTLLSSNLSLLSDPFHLSFSSVHIVGTLTSKLPSINIEICAAAENRKHRSTIVQCLQVPDEKTSLHTPRNPRIDFRQNSRATVLISSAPSYVFLENMYAWKYPRAWHPIGALESDLRAAMPDADAYAGLRFAYVKSWLPLAY